MDQRQNRGLLGHPPSLSSRPGSLHQPGRGGAALARFAEYYNYHRLSGVLGWVTPAERYDGTPFTDQGFQNIPALVHLQPWLEEVISAA